MRARAGVRVRIVDGVRRSVSAHCRRTRSTAGSVSLCAGAVWSWAVETLRLVALSSTGAEYCWAVNACMAQKHSCSKRSKWISLSSTQFCLTVNLQLLWHVGRRCITSQRTKHVAAKYHYQRQLLLQGTVRFQHQATQVQNC